MIQLRASLEEKSAVYITTVRLDDLISSTGSIMKSPLILSTSLAIIASASMAEQITVMSWEAPIVKVRSRLIKDLSLRKPASMSCQSTATTRQFLSRPKSRPAM